MKWVFLAVALAAIFPASEWMRRDPRNLTRACMVAGVLPYFLTSFHLYMAVISWPLWSGYVKGIEITLLDILAIAIYLALPRAKVAVPFRVSMFLYFGAAGLSVFFADVPMASAFYCWQLARMFLVFAVVSRAAQIEGNAVAFLQGLAFGLVCEALLVFVQRFAFGAVQTSGTFVHQNLLGLVSHFITFPTMALVLAGSRNLLIAASPVAGAVVAVLTVSRATIGFSGLGMVLVFGVSSMRRWTARKAIIAGCGAAAVMVLLPLAVSSFEQRFAEAPLSTDYDERAAFEKAAAAILSDHPFGVGANQYVVVANTQGYNTKAGVAPIAGSGSAHVHNVYLLVAAESGYLGLLTFLAMLVTPLLMAFRVGWRRRQHTSGDLLLGLGVSLFVVYLHSLFEWILVTYETQYVLAIAIGLVGGLSTGAPGRMSNPKARNG